MASSALIIAVVAVVVVLVFGAAYFLFFSNQPGPYSGPGGGSTLTSQNSGSNSASGLPTANVTPQPDYNALSNQGVPPSP